MYAIIQRILPWPYRTWRLYYIGKIYNAIARKDAIAE